MTGNFADRLITATEAKRSQVCVGMDPRIDSLPKTFLAACRGAGGDDEASLTAYCLEKYCQEIIDAVADHVVAVKLQSACFEQYGAAGMAAFQSLTGYVQKMGLLAIADAKRGDIGLSAEAYAAAFLGRPDSLNDGNKGINAAAGSGVGIDADAMTVNPLFGSDGIDPFINDCRLYGKGAFVLVKTSNPGSAELQDLQLADGGTFHERLALMVKGWGSTLMGEQGYSSLGAVVGATHSGAISRLRELMPGVIFLLPGYGAQGAGAAEVAPAFDENGHGALVTASRSIIYAGKDSGHMAAAADAARRMQKELWQASGRQ